MDAIACEVLGLRSGSGGRWRLLLFCCALGGVINGSWWWWWLLRDGEKWDVKALETGKLVLG